MSANNINLESLYKELVGGYSLIKDVSKIKRTIERDFPGISEKMSEDVKEAIVKNTLNNKKGEKTMNENLKKAEECSHKTLHPEQDLSDFLANLARNRIDSIGSKIFKKDVEKIMSNLGILDNGAKKDSPVDDGIAFISQEDLDMIQRNFDLNSKNPILSRMRKCNHEILHSEQGFSDFLKNPEISKEPISSEDKDPISSEDKDPISSEDKEPISSEDKEPISSEDKASTNKKIKIAYFIEKNGEEKISLSINLPGFEKDEISLNFDPSLKVLYVLATKKKDSNLVWPFTEVKDEKIKVKISSIPSISFIDCEFKNGMLLIDVMGQKPSSRIFFR